MKRLIKYVLLILTLTTSFLLAACSCKGCKKDEATYIEINKSQVTVAIDAEDKLAVTLNGDIDEDEEVVWTVENSDIATISEKGVLKGVRAGNTVVTCRVGDYTDTCDVTVNTGSYLPTLYFENVIDGTSTILSGEAFNFGAYVRYAGKTYYDVNITYEISNPEFGVFNADRFFSNYKTGSFEVTAVAEWRGVKSILLTKTFTVNVIDNVSISIEGVVNEINLYTQSMHRGLSYKTDSYLDIEVVENGVVATTNTSNLSVVVEDQSIATYSYVEKKVVATKDGKYGKTNLRITYTSSKGEQFTSVYTVNVQRPVDNTGKILRNFSALTYTIDPNGLVDAGEIIVEAWQYSQDGTETQLVVKNGKVTGYKSFSNGVNNSKFVVYTDKNVGYSADAEVYGFVIDEASDITELNTFTDVQKSNLSFIVTQNVDAEGVTLKTIKNFSGTFDGAGFTISNLGIDGDGIFGKLLSGSEVKNLAILNARLKGSSFQSILIGETGGVSEGTIHDVYITVNESDIASKNYKNFAIFRSFMPNLVVRGVVVEYPGLKLFDNQGNLIEDNYYSKYGLFASDTGFSKPGSSVASALNYKGLYVISASESKTPTPLYMGRNSQLKIHMADNKPNGNIDDGLYQFMVFANNDFGSQVKTSSQVKHDTIKYTYDTNSGEAGVGVDASTGVEANRWLYYMTPLYEVNLVEGELVITEAKTYNPAAQEIEGYKPAWVTSNKVSNGNVDKADFSGFENRSGVIIMGSGISRYDNYYGFISSRASMTNFNENWDTNSGYPIWKKSIINDINIFAGDNEVSVIELVYDENNQERIKTTIGVKYNGSDIPFTFEVVTGANLLDIENNTITATSAGRAYLRIDVVIDGISYSKYILVDIGLKPGEYEYTGGVLHFSAMNGKLYTRDETTGAFGSEVGLSDIFGVDVELSGAMLNGSRVSISTDKKYVAGASSSSKEVQDGELRLTSKQTSFTIDIKIYSGILSSSEDLKTAFEVDSTTEKIQGYYVLANNITYDYVNYPINHISAKVEDLKNSGFMGVLDGNGHAIDGFVMEYDTTSGLFANVLKGAIVKNIAFTNLKIGSYDNKFDYCANLFAYKTENNFKFENSYVSFTDDICQDGISYGLFYTITKGSGFRMENVIVNTPNPKSYLGVSKYYGRGLFASLDYALTDLKRNRDSDNMYESLSVDAFKDVYIISDTLKGKIYTIVDQVLPYYADGTNKASGVFVASNDYVDLPNGIIEGKAGNKRESDGEGTYKYYSENAVTIPYDKSGAITAYPSGEVELGMKNGTGVLTHIMTIKRYDTFADMVAADYTQVGSWSVNGTGVSYTR